MGTLSDLADKKFVESFDISDWEVETDTGWESISHTNKTIEYDVYELTTESGLNLKCADNHILFDENMCELFAIDSLGKYVQTKHGIDRVVGLKSTGNSENMYDLSVAQENHRYYTNDFLSHNTTVVAAFVCWYILFNEHKTTAILANKASTAREILGRVQFAYELLPKWIQQGVVEWNKGQFVLENGQRVIASATSQSAIRGQQISLLLLDEYAFVQNNIADEFFASVYPTISSGKESKIAVISTPNGMNHFYKIVKGAEAGTNGFNLTKATWKDVPGRDQKWADDQKSVLGEIKFSQENDCAFIGAQDTLISGSKLTAIPVETPVATSETMRIYEEPMPGHQYVITVDSARGTAGDYSAFVVFDVSVLPYKVVAIYADNMISPMLYPGLIMNIAIKYHKAAVLIETNDIGEAVAQALYHDLEYEETMMSTDGILSSFGGRVPGIKTTKRTKAIGCQNLKTLIENDQLVINDYGILYELQNFVAKGVSYEADNGHDDLVMCLVLFAYLTTQSAMVDLQSQQAKDRIIAMRQQIEEDNMLPIGFFSDGTSTEEQVCNF